VQRARGLYLRAARRGFWAEIRLDYLERPDLKKLFRTLPGKVIATNRRRDEGGRWEGTEPERRRVLEEALDLGVHFVDVELASDAGWRKELFARRGKTRLILSWHDFSGTPNNAALEKVFAEMLASQADVVKIVALAAKPEDNLRVLSLIPRARAADREIIAFCMGPMGAWSRVAAPFLESYLTFAPFTRKKGSAPGQITVNEMRRLWKMLK
jgi:3-dehydroquinate dehydratase/shikimate dehydrogenase